MVYSFHACGLKARLKLEPFSVNTVSKKKTPCTALNKLNTTERRLKLIPTRAILRETINPHETVLRLGESALIPWSPYVCILLHLCGLGGWILISICLINFTNQITYVPLCVFMSTCIYCGTTTLHLQRYLLKRILVSFDFLYASFSFTFLSIGCCDVFQ